MSLRMWHSDSVISTTTGDKEYPKQQEVQVVSYLFKNVNITNREGQSKVADLQVSLIGDGPEEDEIVIVQNKGKESPYNIIQRMEAMTGATALLLERIKK